MVALVIGASKESLYAIKKAQNMGFKVIAFDGDSEALGLKAADCGYQVDIRDAENIIRVLNKQNIVPDVILPVPIGRYLITTGEVNDYYKLKGVSKDAADICTDKFLFHEVLSKKGLRNINCTLIPQGMKNIVQDIHFPSVIKPRFGSGSRGVCVVQSAAELEGELISHMPLEEDYIIEDMVEGPEYGIDGAIINGEFKLILLRGKIITLPPARQCVGYYSIVPDQNNKQLFDSISEYMGKVVKEAGINNSLIHADLIISDYKIFVIEVSARPSGHYLHNFFTPMATGVDMIEQFLCYSTKKTHNKDIFIPHDVKQLMIRYFDFEKCKIINIPDKNIIMKKYSIIKYECNIKEGEWMEEIRDGHSIMERGFFIVSGNNLKEVKDISLSIMNEFEKI